MKKDDLNKMVVGTMNYLKNERQMKKGVLAEKLKITASVLSQILSGARMLDLSKIEELENLAGFEIWQVETPPLIETYIKPLSHISKNSGTNQMGEKLKKLPFFVQLKERIKAEIENKYPGTTVIERDTSQYVSINVEGSIVEEKLKKKIFHLLFFKFSRGRGVPILKIEFIISHERFSKIEKEKWFNFGGSLTYYGKDNAEVTDFFGGQKISKKGRPFFRIASLKSDEIEILAVIALRVFELQCGII